jgi:hypothetical protein
VRPAINELITPFTLEKAVHLLNGLKGKSPQRVAIEIADIRIGEEKLFAKAG